ncbi:MAG: inosine-5-monophosphate dehydrogenase [Thermoplasmata archaeon]|nr:MAG: inosine-5-monophosphate dehydrogenase [Thermoplasmata archaeon]
MVMITGKLIKELRESRGITQQKLAETVGISQAHVAKIENEQVNPRLSTINKILSVLRNTEKIRCKKIMKRNIISIKPDDKIKKVVKLMKNFNISQLPVIENGLCIGSITERTIIKNLDRNLRRTKVKDLMEKPFPIISANDSCDTAKALLEQHQAVLLSEKGKIVGIMTKSDLLSLMK